MMAFEHTSPDGKTGDDHRAPTLPEVFLVICALVLLPFTLLGTLAVMATLNFSLDNMSMMAMILAIGFVVSGIVAFVAVKWLLRYVQSHRFTLFAWYRIALGVVLIGLAAEGIVS